MFCIVCFQCGCCIHRCVYGKKMHEVVSYSCIFLYDNLSQYKFPLKRSKWTSVALLELLRQDLIPLGTEREKKGLHPSPGCYCSVPPPAPQRTSLYFLSSVLWAPGGRAWRKILKRVWTPHILRSPDTSHHRQCPQNPCKFADSPAWTPLTGVWLGLPHVDRGLLLIGPKSACLFVAIRSTVALKTQLSNGSGNLWICSFP